MAMRVLVAYASKYGSTAAIAERVGQGLRRAGFGVDVMPADQVVALQRFDAIVLGTAVYAGRWRKQAVEFLKSQVQILSQKPFWIFVSGPTGEGDAQELMQGWLYPESLRAYVEQSQPREITAFHGDLDPDKLNLAERLIIKGVKAPTGDFRDWDHIDAWVAEVAGQLSLVWKDTQTLPT